MINDDLLALIQSECKLFNSMIHGLPHWKRVERNGVYLCQFTGADKKVVVYFAYFHDCMRVNEFADPEHGPRAAKLIQKNKAMLNLSDDQFQMLHQAVSGHTHGRKFINDTIATCWDADRLDIGRVGVPPLETYMLTVEGKRIAERGKQTVLDDYGDVVEIY